MHQQIEHVYRRNWHAVDHEERADMDSALLILHQHNVEHASLMMYFVIKEVEDLVHDCWDLGHSGPRHIRIVEVAKCKVDQSLLVIWRASILVEVALVQLHDPGGLPEVDLELVAEASVGIPTQKHSG